MPADQHQFDQEGLESPADNARLLDGDFSDTADLPIIPRRIRVGESGVGGTLQVLLKGDSAPVTYTNVYDGERFDIRVKRIYVSGTTCSNVIGEW